MTSHGLENVSLAERVVIVTGAGGGMGRSHALLLAARGAQVVVNDLPSTSGPSGAERVVEEIRAHGGTAVVSHANVAEAEQSAGIVDLALRTYGHVDAVVANAGIHRTAPYESGTLEEFDRIMGVNFFGAYFITRAALPYMRRQHYGRVIFTTSSVALYGYPDRPAYIASKAAVLGLSRALAIDGAVDNILSNAIAPYAYTPMSQNTTPKTLVPVMDPAQVSPLVVYLASGDCRVTNQLYAIGGGGFLRLITAGSPVWQAPADRNLTPEDVRDQIEAMGDITKLSAPGSLKDECNLLFGHRL